MKSAPYSNNQRQNQLDKLIENHAAYPVGDGYGEFIVPREHYADFIDGLTQLGFVVKEINWWCHATEEHKKHWGCPHGMGGPKTPLGWFTELTPDSDDLEKEVLEAELKKDLSPDSIRTINEKAKHLIAHKQTLTKANGRPMNFRENPCLTPGIGVHVPRDWSRKGRGD